MTLIEAEIALRDGLLVRFGGVRDVWQTAQVIDLRRNERAHRWEAHVRWEALGCVWQDILDIDVLILVHPPNIPTGLALTRGKRRMRI